MSDPRIFNVRCYGAYADGEDDTRPFERAIWAATRAGEGTVYVPAGHYTLVPFPRPTPSEGQTR